MSSTTITEMHTVGIDVRDQQAAVRFYVATLGFETRLDAEIGPDMRWVEVAPRGATTSLALNRADFEDRATTDTGVRYLVPDADIEHANLAERGVEVGEMIRWEGVQPMFSFDDPDGNRFYIVEETSAQQ